MRELLGRLTVLDPAASESVKIIDYFDSLVAGGAGAEAIVRAAAILGVSTAAARVRGRVVRIDADGRRLDDGAASAAASEAASEATTTVWFERTSGPTVNDAMILDRARLALAIIETRSAPTTSMVDRVIDPDASRVDRQAAAHRLKLDGAVRVVATPPPGPRPFAGPATVLATPYGAVWVGLGNDVPAIGPVGESVAHDLDDLPRACADALLGLRLADERHPIVDTAELGALIVLARGYDRTAARHPDVVRLAALDTRTLDALDVMVDSESIRGAAAILSLHHSTLQSRHDSWTRSLGYDPLSPRGRARYLAARLLLRLE